MTCSRALRLNLGPHPQNLRHRAGGVAFQRIKFRQNQQGIARSDCFDPLKLPPLQEYNSRSSLRQLSKRHGQSAGWKRNAVAAQKGPCTGRPFRYTLLLQAPPSPPPPGCALSRNTQGEFESTVQVENSRSPAERDRRESANNRYYCSVLYFIKEEHRVL